jgi:hypothetical protein
VLYSKRKREREREREGVIIGALKVKCPPLEIVHKKFVLEHDGESKATTARRILT